MICILDYCTGMSDKERIETILSEKTPAQRKKWEVFFKARKFDENTQLKWLVNGSVSYLCDRVLQGYLGGGQRTTNTTNTTNNKKKPDPKPDPKPEPESESESESGDIMDLFG